jgi:enterochelin esterase-like enzyme
MRLHRLLILFCVILSTLSACTPSKETPAAPTATSVPTITATAQPVSSPTSTSTCTENSGRVISDSIDDKRLGGALPFNVYLPPCYDANKDQHYPLLYLFHGQDYDQSQWVRLGAPQAVDALVTAGLPPFIIVMPYDHLDTKQPSDDPFNEVFIEKLVPYIDATYRTIPDRAHRALGGLSRGGAWAVHFGVRNWQLFSAIGLRSPAIFFMDANLMRTRLLAIPPDSRPRIHIDLGDQDNDPTSARWLADLLNQLDYDYEWQMYVGEHDETYWRKHINEYLRWYAAGWTN